jgi:hypothetical protein
MPFGKDIAVYGYFIHGAGGEPIAVTYPEVALSHKGFGKLLGLEYDNLDKAGAHLYNRNPGHLPAAVCTMNYFLSKHMYLSFSDLWCTQCSIIELYVRVFLFSFYKQTTSG